MKHLALMHKGSCRMLAPSRRLIGPSGSVPATAAHSTGQVLPSYSAHLPPVTSNTKASFEGIMLTIRLNNKPLFIELVEGCPASGIQIHLVIWTADLGFTSNGRFLVVNGWDWASTSVAQGKPSVFCRRYTGLCRFGAQLVD